MRAGCCAHDFSLNYRKKTCYPCVFFLMIFSDEKGEGGGDTDVDVLSNLFVKLGEEGVEYTCTGGGLAVFVVIVRASNSLMQ